MLVSTSARMGFGGESPVTIGRLVEPVGLHLLMTVVSVPYDEVINDLNPKKKRDIVKDARLTYSALIDLHSPFLLLQWLENHECVPREHLHQRRM